MRRHELVGLSGHRKDAREFRIALQFPPLFPKVVYERARSAHVLSLLLQPGHQRGFYQTRAWGTKEDNIRHPSSEFWVAHQRPLDNEASHTMSGESYPLVSQQSDGGIQFCRDLFQTGVRAPQVQYVKAAFTLVAEAEQVPTRQPFLIVEKLWDSPPRTLDISSEAVHEDNSDLTSFIRFVELFDDRSHYSLTLLSRGPWLWSSRAQRPRTS